MMTNLWLRPGNAHSANNVLQFFESPLHHLGDKTVGLLRADSGFFDETLLTAREGKRVPDIIAARLTQPLQRTIDQAGGGWSPAHDEFFYNLSAQHGHDLDLRPRIHAWRQPHRSR